MFQKMCIYALLASILLAGIFADTIFHKAFALFAVGLGLFLTGLWHLFPTEPSKFGYSIRRNPTMDERREGKVLIAIGTVIWLMAGLMVLLFGTIF